MFKAQFFCTSTVSRFLPMNRITIFLLVATLPAFSFGQAQVRAPVTWSFTSRPASGGTATLVFKATIAPGWHIYSQFMEEDGPLPTTFSFSPDNSYTLNGKTKEEGTPVKFYDQTFMMDIVWFSDSVTFSQAVKLRKDSVSVKGKVVFMACNDQLCLPPEAVEFSIKVSGKHPVKQGKKATGYLPYVAGSSLAQSACSQRPVGPDIMLKTSDSSPIRD
jgi:thiol:disulfide interchange protein DsbD